MTDFHHLYLLFRSYLEDLARNENIVSYSVAMEFLGLSHINQGERKLMSNLLCEIMRIDVETEYPLLSSLVTFKAGINGEIRMPDESYFKSAHNFGRYGGSRSTENKYLFWVAELRSVFDFYSPSSN